MVPSETMRRGEFVRRAGVAVAGLAALRVPSAKAAARAARYTTEPTWSPPPVVVAHAPEGAATGAIFVAPFSGTGSSGPMILGNDGEPLWFLPLANVQAHNFRVQDYLGRHVLTWYEGAPAAAATYGGSCVIYDPAYRELKRVHGGNGYSCDLHEFLITTRGTALMAIANEVVVDLTSLGGAADARVVEGIVQELDIETGKVLFEWHSLDDVPVSDSYRSDVTAAGNIDYFHLNSIAVDLDDNLLVSSRHTATVYKLDRKTGAVLWRLGGKRTDFELGPGATFWFQHDVRHQRDQTITLFDNGATDAGTGRAEPASRPLRLGLDLASMTAELVQVYQAPDPRLTVAMGNVQQLADGGVFVGWGTAGAFTEFAPDGTVRYDARFGDGSVSYRAFRSPWVGDPATKPAIVVTDGPETVHVSWNGATEVVAWGLLAGPAADRLSHVSTVARDGFETALAVPMPSSYVSVAALDAAGRRLATSAIALVH